MGITARGAWESVKRHIRALGVNTQTTEFTVAGIGDMSGDVFGNGMLLSHKIRLQLAALHSAALIEDLDLPGYRLHPLKGADKGRWSIWVNGNWRLTFAFRDGHVFDLDFEDYH